MKKLIFGLFGIIIGLCIGTFMKNYQTLEIVSMCNSMLNMRQKCKLYYFKFITF